MYKLPYKYRSEGWPHPVENTLTLCAWHLAVVASALARGDVWDDGTPMFDEWGPAKFTPHGDCDLCREIAKFNLAHPMEEL